MNKVRNKATKLCVYLYISKIDDVSIVSFYLYKIVSIDYV